MKRIKSTAILTVLALVLSSCSTFTNSKTPRANKKVKNIIFLIGDGMGVQQLSLLYHYYNSTNNKKFKNIEPFYQRMGKEGQVGLAIPHPQDNLVIDSACSATHLATGKMSRAEMIGVDKNGDAAETILERAKKLKMATGLVSDTRITHATPAAFASHVAHRSMENEIAADMIEISPDVMLSGGLRHFIPKNTDKEWLKTLPKQFKGLKSKRKDNLNLIEKAKANGHEIVLDKNSLLNSESDKLLGLFTKSGMPNGIWYTQNQDLKDRTIPTLEEMSKKAIDTLSKNENGFFLMIEGGQIDWAGHANDVGTLLHQMIHFDNTVRLVLDWAKDRDDTLVVVTADHETGGFGFSYSRYNPPLAQELSGNRFTDRKFQPNYNFGATSIVDTIYKQSMSQADLLREFHGYPKAEKTPQNLQKLLAQHIPYKFTLKQVKRMLKKEKNHYHDPNFKATKEKYYPAVHDFKEFYTNTGTAASTLIARAMAKMSNTVWATGSHTSTPVGVFAVGPKDAVDKFNGVYHNTKVGELLFEAIDME